MDAHLVAFKKIAVNRSNDNGNTATMRLYYPSMRTLVSSSIPFAKAWQLHPRHFLSASTSSVVNPAVVGDSSTSTPGSSLPPSRRRRRQGNSKRLDEEKVPSYKEFVHRFTVVNLYRGYLKKIREAMPHNRDDLQEQVRHEFRRNKADTDTFNIQRALSEGKRRFAELQEFIGDNSKYEGNSWMNIQDAEDPRGRVGQGWPWQKRDDQ